MKIMIDRFEGDLAVAELAEGNFATLSRKLIPDAKEGDVVEIRLLPDESKRRKEKIDNLMNQLFVDSDH